MKKLTGKGVCAGIAMGKISFLKKEQEAVPRIEIADPQAEIARFEQAKKKALTQLAALYEKACLEVGEAQAQIFDIHQMMVEDLDYNDSVTGIISLQNVNAEYAVSVTAENFALMFSSMDDEYMCGRAADVKDISGRLIHILMGRPDTAQGGGKRIVCADDITPSETVQMDKGNVLAFVTAEGSSNSHTAILARTMDIPAVVAVGGALCAELDGMDAIVDGGEGVIYLSPDEETIARMTEKAAQIQKRRELMKEFKGKETVTLDGKSVKLYANIGGFADVGPALQYDAEGVGLFRSEFLYLESEGFPDEETQLSAYQRVLESMGARRVIIRTLDIGADKQIAYFNLPKEENPALGYRAIRICLTQPEIFKTQLRALLRASVYGKLSIMFPMITSLWELLRAKELLAEAQTELTKEGIAFDPDIEIGVMIETPAAALISDMLAKEVDFFSIGSNDLTQYTLAVDRQNPKLEKFYDPYHEALKRMMKLVIDNAHAAGIWVGVCGELGGDLNMTEWFLHAGVDELSVSPPVVLELRKKIRETDTRKLNF